MSTRTTPKGTRPRNWQPRLVLNGVYRESMTCRDCGHVVTSVVDLVLPKIGRAYLHHLAAQHEAVCGGDVVT